MRLPARSSPFLFALIQGGVMTLVVASVLTWTSLGRAGFPGQWLHNWGYAWMLATPCILLFAPLVQRLVARMVAPAAAERRAPERAAP